MDKLYNNKEWLIEQYVKKRKSMSAIAKEAGCWNGTIRSRLVKFGIDIKEKHNKLLDDANWLMYHYINLQESTPEIAELLKTSAAMVCIYLAKHHIERRTQPEAQEIRCKKYTYKCSNETKQKLSESHKGIPRSNETKQKISLSLKGKYAGENSCHWRGGISCEPYCPKWTPEFRNRIRAFFNYECVICGKSTEENNRELCCHHVEYNKQACCDGKPVHFAALCRSCHGKTNHNKEQWQEIIHRIIDEIYDGRSYYTKEEYINLVT